MQTTDVISSAISLYIRSISSVKSQKELDSLNEEFGNILKNFFIKEGIVLNTDTNEFVKTENPKKTTTRKVVIKDVPVDQQCTYVIKPVGKPERKCILAKLEDGAFCKQHSKNKNKTSVGTKSQHALNTITSQDVKKFAGENNLIKGLNSSILADGFSSKFSGAVPINHIGKNDIKLNHVEGSDVKIEPETNFLFKKQDDKYHCVGKKNGDKQEELNPDDLALLATKEQKYTPESVNLPKESKFSIDPKASFSSSSSKFSFKDDADVDEMLNELDNPKKQSPQAFASKFDASFLKDKTDSKFSFDKPLFSGSKASPGKFTMPFDSPNSSSSKFSFGK